MEVGELVVVVVELVLVVAVVVEVVVVEWAILWNACSRETRTRN